MSDLSHHDAQLDFRNDMSYGDYLGLDGLLAAQHPLTDAHDEMLFIVQHQTSELWMRLMLHELGAITRRIRADELNPAFKMMARVSRIMEQLVHAWDVLSTMTPSEYSTFRGRLGHSSGFQSHQYRLIEFAFGNKNGVMLRPHEHHPENHAVLTAALHAPSLYDEAIQLLARRGFDIEAGALARDWSMPYDFHPSVEQAWIQVYRSPDTHWQLYELAEEFMDMEDAFRQWRFRHVTTVERVIGFKRGTGGTTGVGYLRKMLDVVLFPELWRVRTDL